MTTVTIPSTIEGATQRLGAIGKLLTAQEWERAAIVWAFTEERQQGQRTDIVKTDKVGFVEFAALGIHGLRSKNTVQNYHQRWQEAIEKEYAKPAQPGKDIQLPDLEWTPVREGTGHERNPRHDMTYAVKHLDVEDIVEVMTDSFAARAKIEGPGIISDLIGLMLTAMRPLLPGPVDVIERPHPRQSLSFWPKWIAEIREGIEAAQNERPDEYVDLIISVCEAMLSVLRGDFDADLAELLGEAS